MAENRNCLSYWFPRLFDAGLPVPKTVIVKTDLPLTTMLEGSKPAGFDDFMAELEAAVDRIGVPCFLRTGHTSNKHDWGNSCFLSSKLGLLHHVYNLVEFSEMADFMGMQTNVWAVREFIVATPLFHAFDGFPVTREFRVFVDGGIDCIHPYWPPKSIRSPCDQNWASLLDEASKRSAGDNEQINALALKAAATLPGAWSVDILQDSDGKWWVTDCADAGCSYHWDGCVNAGKKPRRDVDGQMTVKTAANGEDDYDD